MYLLAALQYQDPTILRKPARPVPRPRKACRTCRNLKTKCLPGDAGPTGRCARCARLGIECEYIHLPRGPRKGSTRSRAPYTGSQSPPFRSPPSPTHARAADDCSHRSFEISHERDYDCQPASKRQKQWNSDSQALPTPSTVNDSPTGTRTMSVSGPPSLEQDTPGYESMSSVAANHDTAPQALNFLATEMRTTLEEYLDPSAQEDHPKQSQALMADVVSAGLLTECDACYLFRRFEQQVSPSSHLFDPGYHTFERVRKSVPLFNAIMYASARFFAPNVADALFEMASTMANRALQAGTVDLALVQALLVLVYWKKPKDPTAYHKLGLATRLMCQLRVEWDVNPDPSVPIEQERAKVDAERTSYNAFSMDSSYAMMLRLPVMPWSLPKSEDLMCWATAHRHLNVPGDYFKVFVTECWELQRGIGNVSSDGRASIDGDGIIQRITAMTERWDLHPCLTGVLRYLAKLLSKTFLLKAHIVAARAKNNCVSIACILDDISEIIRHLKVSGDAVFLNDLSTSMLSTPAVIVYNGRNDFDPDTMACAAAFVRDMSDLFRTLPPHTPEDHALRYVQRCYLRVEGALDKYTAGMFDAHDNIVGQLHELLADNWPALAFSPEEAISASVLDPNWLASMQFM